MSEYSGRTKLSSMAADALTAQEPSHQTAMLLDVTGLGKTVVVFYQDGSQLPAQSGDH